MTDEPDIEAIARGLDERQVRFIMGISQQIFAPSCGHEDIARLNLRKAGIVRHEHRVTGTKWYLTPLGLRVRTYLMENPDGQ